jgi:hypothetical protein
MQAQDERQAKPTLFRCLGASAYGGTLPLEKGPRRMEFKRSASNPLPTIPACVNSERAAFGHLD